MMTCAWPPRATPAHVLHKRMHVWIAILVCNSNLPGMYVRQLVRPRVQCRASVPSLHAVPCALHHSRAARTSPQKGSLWITRHPAQPIHTGCTMHRERVHGRGGMGAMHGHEAAKAKGQRHALSLPRMCVQRGQPTTQHNVQAVCEASSRHGRSPACQAQQWSSFWKCPGWDTSGWIVLNSGIQAEGWRRRGVMSRGDGEHLAVLYCSVLPVAQARSAGGCCWYRYWHSSSNTSAKASGGCAPDSLYLHARGQHAGGAGRATGGAGGR